MESPMQLAKRMRELVLDGKWIANTNYKEQISDLSLKEAMIRKGDSNSIAALCFHVNYYFTGFLEFFKYGTFTIKDRFSFDMPELSEESDWEDIRTALLTNTESMTRSIERLTENELNATFVKQEYGTLRRNLEALIEHGYYHLGQLVLIKKWIRSGQEH